MARRTVRAPLRTNMNMETKGNCPWSIVEAVSKGFTVQGWWRSTLRDFHSIDSPKRKFGRIELQSTGTAKFKVFLRRLLVQRFLGRQADAMNEVRQALPH